MSSARVSRHALAPVAGLGCLLLVGITGCGNSNEDDAAARAARMTVDDSAHELGPGEQTLTGPFDVTTNALAKALPAEQLRTTYTELQQMDAETLTPSEASGCNPDKVGSPAVPAAELLATKPPALGKQQPEIADVVAARASDDASVDTLIAAIRKAAAGCAKFSETGRDLGEGSFDPGEKGATTVSEANTGEWTGVRTVTPVTVTGANWTQKLVRESLVLRRGQVVVHVRVEAPDEATATGRVDDLMSATLANVDRAADPATAGGSQAAPTGATSATGEPTVRSSDLSDNSGSESNSGSGSNSGSVSSATPTESGSASETDSPSGTESGTDTPTGSGTDTPTGSTSDDSASLVGTNPGG